MSSLNAQIREAISAFDVDKARALLRDALKEADSETYYLASRVALDDAQKLEFLQKAVAADTFNKEARADLLNLQKAPAPAPAQTAVPAYTPPPGPSRPADRAASGDASDRKSSEPWFTERWVPNAQRESGAASGRNSGAGEYVPGDTGRRIVAYLIDSVIASVFVFVIGYVIGAVFAPNPYNMGYSEYSFQISRLSLIASIVGALFVYVYWIGFTVAWNGQTPGKRAMKLRIVKKNGSPFTITDGLVRYLIGYTLSFLIFGLGFIWGIFDSRRETWHDKLSKTMVIAD